MSEPTEDPIAAMLAADAALVAQRRILAQVAADFIRFYDADQLAADAATRSDAEAMADLLVAACEGYRLVRDKAHRLRGWA